MSPIISFINHNEAVNIVADMKGVDTDSGASMDVTTGTDKIGHAIVIMGGFDECILIRNQE